MNPRTRRLRRLRRVWVRDCDRGWLLVQVRSHGSKRLRWLWTWGPTSIGAGNVQWEDYVIARLTRGVRCPD